MKLYLDTADVSQVRTAVDWGVIHGVTTNPTLIAREGRDFHQVISEMTQATSGPVSAEVVSTEAAGMLEEAHELAAIAKNVVIKIPMIPEGMKAVKQLAAEGINTNVTLVFSANQALLAAHAGASYVSPFVGRLDDIGEDGLQLVRDIVTIYDTFGIDTEIITASVRHPNHVLQAALAGADIATLPFSILEKMFKHPMTDQGLERFLRDWEAAQGQ